MSMTLWLLGRNIPLSQAPQYERACYAGWLACECLSSGKEPSDHRRWSIGMAQHVRGHFGRVRTKRSDSNVDASQGFNLGSKGEANTKSCRYHLKERRQAADR